MITTGSEMKGNNLGVRQWVGLSSETVFVGTIFDQILFNVSPSAEAFFGVSTVQTITAYFKGKTKET